MMRARPEDWYRLDRNADGVTLIFVQIPETHPLRRDTRND